jgi:hypothetical protein
MWSAWIRNYQRSKHDISFNPSLAAISGYFRQRCQKFLRALQVGHRESISGHLATTHQCSIFLAIKTAATCFRACISWASTEWILDFYSANGILLR